MSLVLPEAHTAEHPANAGCYACGAEHLVDIFESRQVPVHVGIFYDSEADARATPRGDIILSHCPNCSFTFNRAFDPSLVFYQPGYEVALHHSAVFRDYISRLITRLISRFSLNGKTILEIGSGDAWFLKQLCQTSKSEGIGVDPSSPYSGRREFDFGSLELIQDYYSPVHHELSPDFVCCLSALEHVANPFQFLKMVRSNLQRTKIGVYFEVFNAFRAFERGEIWSPHYEQCNYFSLPALKKVFERTGFLVSQSGTDYAGDQYLFVEAETTSVPNDSGQPVEAEAISCSPAIEAFIEAQQASEHLWQGRFAEWSAAGETVAFWGAAGKGISFLNQLPGAGMIDCVVDINPDKHGKFIPGTGQQIVPPEALAANPPSKLIISNALYREEISHQMREMNIACDLYIA